MGPIVTHRARFRGLYGIAGPVGGVDTFAMAEAYLSAGVPVLQYRDKQADGRALLEMARLLRKLTRERGALFIVNDRLDVALLAEADGVHVGQDDLPVEEVRRVAAALGRDDLVVGLSTHDLGQVRAALERPVDYIGFGPVFGTTTKADALPSRGVGMLAEAVRLAGALPVVAIGGVSSANVTSVRTSGAPMAAVIGDIAAASDRSARARDLHAALS